LIRTQARVVLPMDVKLLTLGEPVEYEAIRSAVDWVQRSVTVYGKVYPQPRLTRWYGDVPYVYSGLTWEPSKMPVLVDKIRERVEALSGERFNSVLCNLYRDGFDSVGWHADDEPIFGGDPVVASVSFGAERVFKLRRNDGIEQREFALGDGALLVMGKGMQRDWEHSIPKTAKPVGERINLTFRWALG
jgi:alkylated DNA repair dioxygenase AlkB